MSAPGLNWNDGAACRAWLADVASLCKDAVEVAEDQTLPIGKRRLGRASALHLLKEAKGGLVSQLRYARAGLMVGPRERRPPCRWATSTAIGCAASSSRKTGTS
jgi:hypothetical protein